LKYTQTSFVRNHEEMSLVLYNNVFTAYPYFAFSFVFFTLLPALMRGSGDQ